MMIDISREMEKLEICGMCEKACEKDGIPTCQQENKPIIVIVSTNTPCPLEKWV